MVGVTHPERKIRVPLGVTFTDSVGQEGRKAVFNLDSCKTGNQVVVCKTVGKSQLNRQEAAESWESWPKHQTALKLGGALVTFHRTSISVSVIFRNDPRLR